MSEKEERIRRGIRTVRLGHGANCSSIGSVIDTLFVSAVVGGAIFAAVAAALAREKEGPSAVGLGMTPSGSTPTPTPTPDGDA